MNEYDTNGGWFNITSLQIKVIDLVDNLMSKLVDVETLHHPDVIFQLKILVVLLACLIITILLNAIAWNVYGGRISLMFMGETRGQDSTDEKSHANNETVNKVDEQHLHRE